MKNPVPSEPISERDSRAVAPSTPDKNTTLAIMRIGFPHILTPEFVVDSLALHFGGRLQDTKHWSCQTQKICRKLQLREAAEFRVSCQLFLYGGQRLGDIATKVESSTAWTLGRGHLLVDCSMLSTLQRIKSNHVFISTTVLLATHRSRESHIASRSPALKAFTPRKM